MSNNLRCISPHLQEYRLPFSAIMSVAHRISGLAIYFFLIFFCWSMILWCYTDAVLSIFYASSYFKYGFVPIFIFSFSLHLCGGFRYIAWTLGFCYDKKWINIISALTAILALILSTAIFLLCFCKFNHGM